MFVFIIKFDLNYIPKELILHTIYSNIKTINNKSILKTTVYKQYIIKGEKKNNNIR